MPQPRWRQNYWKKTNYKVRKFFISLVGLLLSACSSTADKSGKDTITVSIEPQRKLLESIAGDRFEVVTMLSRGSDPETFDPSLSARRVADNSVAYFALGAFPFEESLKVSLPADVKFIDVSAGIEPLYGTHGACHNHAHKHHAEEADPHIWTSVVNMRIMARNMTENLCMVDSANESFYRSRFAALSAHLDSLDSALASVVPTGSSFAIWHPSLSYFARDYGLKQIAVGHESKEMPAKRLKAVIDSARTNNVKVLFFQKEYDSRQVSSLNDEMGSRVVEIDPLAYDWENELIRIADELSRP